MKQRPSGWLLCLEEQRVLLKVPYDSSLDGCLVVGQSGLSQVFWMAPTKIEEIPGGCQFGDFK